MDSWCTWEPSAVALPTGIQSVGGQVRCRLWAVGWGGGLVVVRARERRVHGEGGQQVSSRGTGRPGGVAGEYRRPGLRLVRGGAPGTGDSDQVLTATVDEDDGDMLGEDVGVWWTGLG